MARFSVSLQFFLVACACLAGVVPTGGAVAADQPAATARVEIEASGDYGELPYRYFVAGQRQLRRHIPQDALVDMWLRASYPGMDEPQRDDSLPGGWAIAVLSRSVDIEVPVRRGGFFLLPEIQEAWDEDATIMFRKVNRPWLGIWWTLRVPATQRIAYADIGKARQQIAAVQRRISLYDRHLHKEKRERYDGIKACFHGGSGHILVEGKLTENAVSGNCKVLFTNPALVASEAVVEFVGPLSFVSFVDQSYYPRRR